MNHKAIVRKTYRLLGLVAPMALYLASHNPGWAADAEAIGEPMPSGTEPSSVPAELSSSESPEMQSLALPGKRVAETLSQASLEREEVVTRGATDKGVYKSASPSVPVVLAGDGGGAGAYIGSNQIVTSLHVVDGSPTVDVVFKYEQGVSFRAVVSKIDRQRDLALLTLAFEPPVSPLKLGSMAQIQEGDDVYAIGHPRRQWWTFTKGLVSAIRPNYTWIDENGAEYQATVIQTQTPINPGNSGGPLLNEDAEVVGINSFLAPDAQGLNYAVSVDDVQSFLKSSARPPSAPPKKVPDRLCEARKLYEGKGRVRGASGWLIQYDTDCDGRVDFSYFYPTKKSRSYLALIDTNSDGKNDIEIQDRNRDRKWDVSYHDTNHDGRADLVGRHPDGKLEPSYFDRFAGG